MPRGLICFALLLAFPLVLRDDHSDKPDFPDDSKINLLVNQSARAFETYEAAIKQEQRELGDQGVESAARDRQVLDRARKYLPKLKANPKAFNSAAGFL